MPSDWRADALAGLTLPTFRAGAVRGVTAAGPDRQGGMLRSLFRSCLLLSVFSLRAGGVEIARGTVHRNTMWAPTLGAMKHMMVYLPPSYDTTRTATKRYPVAIYLHGRWGDETDIVKLGRLAASMDSLIAGGMPEMIVAMPDGDDGWWTTWNSASDMAECARTPHRDEPAAEFCVPNPNYDYYVAHDVTQFVDSTYRTLARRESRAIGGYSMGGYGSFTIAARYPEVFGVAVSHGGVLTPGLMADSTTLSATGQVTWRIGRSNAELRKASGPNEWGAMFQMFGVDPTSWHARDPASLFLAVKARGAPMPVLYADAGIGDERLQQNETFRATLEANHIPLSYAEWKGKHTWKYVQAHLPEGLHFIADRMTR